MPTPVSLTRLVDQSIGTPEAGAVNFRALRDLLLAIVGRLGGASSSSPTTIASELVLAQDAGSSVTTPAPAPPPPHPAAARGSKTATLAKSTIADLLDRADLAEWADKNRTVSMPTNADIVRSIQHEKPLTDFWQFAQLSKRVESHDQGIEKLFHLVQDLIKDLKDVKQTHDDVQNKLGKLQTQPEHVIGKLEEIRSKVQDMDDIRQQLSTIQEDMSLYPPAEVLATWGGLEDAICGARESVFNMGQSLTRKASAAVSTPAATGQPQPLPQQQQQLAPKPAPSCPLKRQSAAAVPAGQGSVSQSPIMSVPRRSLFPAATQPSGAAGSASSQPATSSAVVDGARPEMSAAAASRPDASATSAQALPRRVSIRAAKNTSSGSVDGPSPELAVVLARLGKLDERHSRAEQELASMQQRIAELERELDDLRGVGGAEPAQGMPEAAVGELSEELQRLRDRLNDIDMLVADVPVTGDPTVPPIGDKSRSNSLNVPEAAGAATARLTKSANVPAAQRPSSSVDSHLRGATSDKKDAAGTSLGRDVRDAEDQYGHNDDITGGRGRDDGFDAAAFAKKRSPPGGATERRTTDEAGGAIRFAAGAKVAHEGVEEAARGGSSPHVGSEDGTAARSHGSGARTRGSGGGGATWDERADAAVSSSSLSTAAARTHSLSGLSGAPDRRSETVAPTAPQAAAAKKKQVVGDGGAAVAAASARDKSTSQSLPSVESRDARLAKSANVTAPSHSESAVRRLPSALRGSVAKPKGQVSIATRSPATYDDAHPGVADHRSSPDGAAAELRLDMPRSLLRSRPRQSEGSNAPPRYSSTLREIVRDDYMGEIRKLQRRVSAAEEMLAKVLGDLEESNERELEDRIDALSGQFACNVQDLSKRLDDAEAFLKDLPYPTAAAGAAAADTSVTEADSSSTGALAGAALASASGEQADTRAIRNAQQAILAMQEELRRLQQASTHLGSECIANDEVQTDLESNISDAQESRKKKEALGRDAFNSLCTDLQKTVSDLLSQLKAYEDAWKLAHGRLEASVGNKLERSELDRLRAYIDSKLRDLQRGFKKARGIAPELCMQAALLKRRLLPFSCLSCDKPVYVEPTNNRISALPVALRNDADVVDQTAARDAKVHASHSGSALIPSAAADYSCAGAGQSNLPQLAQQTLAQLKSASPLRAYLVHYGQRVPRGGPKIFITRSKQRVLCPGVQDIYGRPRSCGGRYTSLRTPKKKISTIKDILANEDLVAVGNVTRIEEDIEGADGLLYKGRSDVVEFETPSQPTNIPSSGVAGNLPCTPYGGGALDRSASANGGVYLDAPGVQLRSASPSVGSDASRLLHLPSVPAAPNASSTSAASAPPTASRPQTPLLTTPTKSSGAAAAAKATSTPNAR